MRIEVKLDRRNQGSLPKNGLAQIEAELKRRVDQNNPGTEVVVRFATATDINLTGFQKEGAKTARKMIEQMFDQSDDWLISDEFSEE